MKNWALIGTGRVSEQIAAAINKSSSAKVGGVYSRSAENREKFAAAFAVSTAYESLDQLLSDDAIEIVYIASPNSFHREHVVASARAGKQILCEKPLASDIHSAITMIEVCNNSKVKFGVGFQYRQHPAHRKIKELVGSGALGEIVFADSAVHLPPMPYPDWYHNQDVAGGGVLPMTGVHRLDLLRYVLGSEVTEVYSKIEKRDSSLPFEDTVTAVLSFANKSSATVRFAMNARSKGEGISVNGRNGWAIAADTTSQWWSKRPGSLEYASGEEIHSVDYADADLYLNQVEEFTGWVEDRNSFATPAIDGLRAIEITLALQESSKVSQPVKVHHYTPEAQ